MVRADGAEFAARSRHRGRGDHSARSEGPDKAAPARSRRRESGDRVAGLLRAVPVPVALVGMLALAGLALGRIYHGPLLAELVAGAAAGSVAVSVATRRLPAWVVAPVSMVALAGYAAWVLRLTAQRAQLPGPFAEVAGDALRNGIPRLLTAMIPVEPQPDTVIVPVVAAWLAGLAGAELAVRGGRVLLGYAPPALLYAGALYAVGPNADTAVWPTLGYAALAATGLAATGRSTGPPSAVSGLERSAIVTMRLRLATGAAAGLAVIVALAAVVGPVVAARVGATPVDPRQYVPPPQVDTLDENPLIRISGWALNPDQHLLDVSLSGAGPAAGTSSGNGSGDSGAGSGGGGGGGGGGVQQEPMRKQASSGRAQPEPIFGGGEHAPNSSARAQPEPVFDEAQHAPNSSARAQPEPVFDEAQHAPNSPGPTQPPAGDQATAQDNEDGGGTSRIRLAVLNDYDGITWRVGATYRGAGRVLPEPVGPAGPVAPAEQPGPGARTRQEITIDELAGRLLPAVADPREVDGVRVAYDPGSGTLIRPEGLTAGLRYTVDSVVERPDVNLLPTADVPAGPAVARVLALGEGVPPEMERLADQLGEDNGAAYERALAIEQFLSEHYRLVTDAPSGHAYPNLKFFLFGPRNGGGQRGTSEQFAASFAVLGRLMGLPTRVVVGFQLRPGTAQVRGSDGYAWPEVLFSDVGWVSFDPLPRPRTQPRPVEEDFRPKPETSTPPPSDAPTPTLSATPSGKASAAAAEPPDASGYPMPLITGGLVTVVALLLAGYATGVPLLRRAQRRRRLAEGDPGRRITGAWLEVTDALRLAGRPAQPYLAATEVAEHAAAAALPPANRDKKASHEPGAGRKTEANHDTEADPDTWASRDAEANHDARPGHDTGAGRGARVRSAAPPPIDGLAALVNQTSFAPTGGDETQARYAADQAVAYVTGLRAGRPWWRRLLWSMHPGPLRWHRNR